MAPDRLEAFHDLLLLLFTLVAVPVSWLYADRRGRRPWLWALFAFFIGWIGVLLLRILPDNSKPSEKAPESGGDTSEAEAIRERLDRIRAEQHLRSLLRK